MGSLCEEKIYSSFFKSHATALYNYIYYKCGKPNLAQDIVQEAFLKVWQNCSSIIFETAKAYVYKSAGNMLLNQYKHDQVVLKFEKQSQRKSSVEDPEYLLEEKEFKLSLEKAISELPEKQREVFLMSRIDKKKYREIAEILGISKQAVEKRMYNALDALRRISKKIR